MTTRKKYDLEFKQRAVKLSYSSERTVAEVAKSLGIDKSMLYQWRKRYTPEGEKTAAVVAREDELKLRARIAELEEENDILKKATAYFAKKMK